MSVKVLDKKLSLKEYEAHLLSKGIISKIPKRTGKISKELENFKPLEIKGESLSESIIKERC